MKSKKISINFQLRPKKKADGSQLINISISQSAKRKVRGTGISTKEKHWNQKRQKVRSADKLSIEKNNRLGYIRSTLEKSYLMNTNQDLNDLANELEKILNPKSQNDDSLFKEHYKDFLEKSKKNNGPRTFKNKLYLLSLLEDYTYNTRVPLSYEHIDVRFLNGFIDYLRTKGLAHNTVRGHFKRLKAFLNYGIVNDFHNNLSHNKIKMGEVESNQLFLDESQIDKFFNVESDEKELDEAQDIAIFMYSTLQRYSDVRDFEFSMVKIHTIEGEKNYYWDLKTNKTDSSIKVPLTDKALELVNDYKSYGMKQFPVPSNQVLNRRLKRIGELAGLHDFASNISSRLKNYDKVRWETPRIFHFIGCHTFRRSGITNKIMNDIPINVIRKISGHKDSKSFQKYVELAESYVFKNFLGK